MIKNLVIASISCFSLFGCIADNPQSPQPKDTGSAQIRFPVVPAEALLKGSKSIRPVDTLVYKPVKPRLSFQISVTGPGMDSIAHEWPAYEFSGKSVTFEAIPSGSFRTFTGAIIRDGIITHSGTYTTDIQPNQTAIVPLVLRDIRTGRAEICMEVEGWPGSPDCVQIDTIVECVFPVPLPEPIIEPTPEPILLPSVSVAGCWKLKDARTPARSYPAFGFEHITTQEYAYLNLEQSGNQAFGTAHNPNDVTYRAVGTFVKGDLQIAFYPKEARQTLFYKPIYMNISLFSLDEYSGTLHDFSGRETDSTFSDQGSFISATRTECQGLNPISPEWPEICFQPPDSLIVVD